MHDFVGVGKEIGDGGASDGMPEVDEDEGPTICGGAISVCKVAVRSQGVHTWCLPFHWRPAAGIEDLGGGEQSARMLITE